jgi:hypothetical protein
MHPRPGFAITIGGAKSIQYRNIRAIAGLQLTSQILAVPRGKGAATHALFAPALSICAGPLAGKILPFTTSLHSRICSCTLQNLTAYAP